AAVAAVVDEAGGDGQAALDEVDSGRPAKVLATEHRQVVSDLDVFGVPTFIVGDDAVFVRLMERPAGDAALATRTIERILDTMVGWPALNELKHTRIPF